MHDAPGCDADGNLKTIESAHARCIRPAVDAVRFYQTWVESQKLAGVLTGIIPTVSLEILSLWILFLVMVFSRDISVAMKSQVCGLPHVKNRSDKRSHDYESTEHCH